MALDAVSQAAFVQLANVAHHFVKELTIRPLTVATITPTTIVRVWPNMFFMGDFVDGGDGSFESLICLHLPFSKCGLYWVTYQLGDDDLNVLGGETVGLPFVAQ